MTNEPEDDGPGRQALDAFDRDLRALLRVEPSAGFVAGVRARIEEARPSRSAWWWLAPALAASLAAVFAARALTRPALPHSTPREAAMAPQPPPIAAPVPVPPRTPAPAAGGARPAMRVATRTPDVIVDPAQERALLRFVANVNAPGASAPASLTASTSLDAPLPPPPPLEIAPLEAPGSDS